MNERFFFSSHSLKHLADALFRELSSDHDSIFSRALIVIPPGGMKEWLTMELCQRADNKSILGLRVISWETALLHLAGALPIPTRASLLAAIWQTIEKKKIEFVQHLATVFWSYFQSGFPSEIPEEMLWQKKLFEKICESHSWLTLPEALARVAPKDIGPLYFFGIDHLPTAVHRFFLQYTKLNVFRFSPTSMFWEDIHRADHTHPLLSNWGSLGRKMLADASVFPSQEDENYEIEESASNLYRLKLDFLLLEKQEFEKDCPSITCFQTGSSKLKEVQTLRQTMLALAEEGIALSEMRIYAPDIGPYVPLIEFCFGTELPYRIRGIDFARQSPFYQAILHLFRCVEGRWGQEEILALFETSAFYRKMNWQLEEVKKFREWVSYAKIRWGVNADHRKKLSEMNSGAGTWKEGFESLFDSWIFLQPEKEKVLSWVDADLFQEFYEKFNTLQQTLLSWKEEKTLIGWADEIERLIHTTLFLEDTDRAGERIFSQFLALLRKTAADFPSERYPFSFVESYFTTFSSDELSRSSLHAPQFSSFDSGTILPAEAIFLLGMDEENFPRRSISTSLCLAAEQPSPSEKDRYHFLQAIFAAKKRLIFSYSHLSKEDGKSVNPSLLIQELFGHIGPHFKKGFASLTKPKNPSFLTNLTEIPPLSSVPRTISIQDLARFFKNPFQYYLKARGLVLKEEVDSNWEEFSMSGLDRYLALRGSLTGPVNMELPLGLFGKAANLNVKFGIEEFQESLEKWAIEAASIQTLSFKETDNPLELNSILLVGEVGLSVPTGVLHMGSDCLNGYLRKWPEILIALIATGSHQIYSLKTAKVRHLANPRAALQSAIELYLRCQNHLFFLHPEWADDVLRKGRVPTDAQDPIVQWALKRSPDYSLAIEKEIWKEMLHQTFKPLTALFERGNHAAV